MQWQTRVKQLASELGLTITSAPGALDVGGNALQLVQMFAKLEEEFQGRIAELFLHLPSVHIWKAIKNDRPMVHNPEAGRSDRLHVALRDEKEAPQ